MDSRRRFLQKITGSAVALSVLPAALQAIPLDTYDGPVLRIALMGLGGYAERVAESMRACKRA